MNPNQQPLEPIQQMSEKEIIDNILANSNGSWRDMIEESFDAGKQYASHLPASLPVKGGVDDKDIENNPLGELDDYDLANETPEIKNAIVAAIGQSIGKYCMAMYYKLDCKNGMEVVFDNPENSDRFIFTFKNIEMRDVPLIKNPAALSQSPSPSIDPVKYAAIGWDACVGYHNYMLGVGEKHLDKATFLASLPTSTPVHKGGWISVEDGLPKVGEDELYTRIIMVSHDWATGPLSMFGIYHKGNFYGAEMWWSDGDDSPKLTDSITHWQPLPLPPTT